MPLRLLLSSAFCFAVTFFIYSNTTSHSVSGGDSGEVMVAANELAVPHPSGYPTFVMLYHGAVRYLLLPLSSLYNFDTIFSTSSVPHLPESSGVDDDDITHHFSNSDSAVALAFLYNLVSCFLGALAASLINAAAFLWTHSASASVSASLIVALSPSIWTYAIQTEVFALHNVFVALLLFALVWYESRPSLRRAAVGAFVCGLSLTNQHTAVLMVVPLAAWVALYRQFSSLRTRPIAVTLLYVFLFLLGLCPPYAFLVWSARNQNENVRRLGQGQGQGQGQEGEDAAAAAAANRISLIAWGDTSTPEGFLHHFLRADYGTLSLGSKESDYLVKASGNSLKTWKLFLSDCYEQLGGGAWAVLPILGLIYCGATAIAASSLGQTTVKTKGRNEKESRISLRDSITCKVAAAVLLCWVVYTTFFHAFSNLPIDQPLFLGVQQRFWMHPFILIAIFAAPGIAFVLDRAGRNFFVAGIRFMLPLVVLCVQLLRNYSTHDESRNTYVENFGKAILDSLPANSILLTKGDLVINSVRFMQGIKKYRTDVAVLDQELMTYPWFVERAAAKLKATTSTNVSGGSGGVKFPGRYYYPGKKDTFDMAMLLNANNIAPSVAKGRFSRNYRRAFVCYGVKEGDNSLARVGMALRTAGICDEIVRKPQENTRELKQKDASLWALELMRSLPRYAQAIAVPDAVTMTRVEEKKQRRLKVMVSSGNYLSVARHYLSNELSLLTKLMTSHSNYDEFSESPTRTRTAPYDRTSWEAVAASDLSAAIQRVSYALHSIAEMQKSLHPELLTGGVASGESESEKQEARSSATAATTVFPPESWTLQDLGETCSVCTTNHEAVHYAHEQIRLFNKKPALPCASDARTVFMCACYTAERLLGELITRFPQDVTSTVHRNRASIVQTLMQFAASSTNRETTRELQKAMVVHLTSYVKSAKKEKIDPKEVAKLEQAAQFFEKQSKGE